MPYFLRLVILSTSFIRIACPNFSVARLRHQRESEESSSAVDMEDLQRRWQVLQRSPPSKRQQPASLPEEDDGYDGRPVFPEPPQPLPLPSPSGIDFCTGWIFICLTITILIIFRVCSLPWSSCGFLWSSSTALPFSSLDNTTSRISFFVNTWHLSPR